MRNLPVILSWFWLVLAAAVHVSAAAAGQETLIGLTGDGFVLLAADSTCARGAVRWMMTSGSCEMDKIAVLPHNVAVAAVGDVADVDRLVGSLRILSNLQYDETILTHHNHGAITYVDCSHNNTNEDATEGASRRSIADGGGSSSVDALNVHCVAQRARTFIAGRLRSAQPLRVCMLVAGLTTLEDDTQQQQLPFVTAADHVQRQIQTATAAFVTTKPVVAVEPRTTTEEEEVQDPLSGDVRSKQPQQLLQPALYWLDEYGALQRVPYGVHGTADSLLWSMLDRGYRPDLTLPQALSLLQDCFDHLRTRYVINTSSASAQTANARPQFCVKCIDKHGCRLLDLTEATTKTTSAPAEAASPTTGR